MHAMASHVSSPKHVIVHAHSAVSSFVVAGLNATSRTGVSSIVFTMVPVANALAPTAINVTTTFGSGGPGSGEQEPQQPWSKADILGLVALLVAILIPFTGFLCHCIFSRRRSLHHIEERGVCGNTLDLAQSH